MSVRAVAVRTVPRAPYQTRRLGTPVFAAASSRVGTGRARVRVVPRELLPGRLRLLETDTHGNAVRHHTVPSGLLRRWADDRQMIRLKLCVLAALVLLAMALEVPL